MNFKYKNEEYVNKSFRIKNNEELNDNELAERIGISKVTMYTRFKTGEWKETEKALIDQIIGEYNG